MSATAEGFNGWAILEIFGHRKLGGFVQVSPPEMPGLIRVDVFTDGDSPTATQYYGSAAIFALTPTTEDMARRLGRACEVRPVAHWELPAPTPRRSRTLPDVDPDEPDDEDDEDRFSHMRGDLD